MVVTAISPAELNALEASLLNKSGKVALHDRFRALFTLKSLKTDGAVEIISKGVPFIFLNADLAYPNPISKVSMTPPLS